WPYTLAICALALQIVDLSRFAGMERATTAEAAAPQRYARASSPEWDQLIRAADVVEFQPPVPHADIKAVYEIAWRASSVGRPINGTYPARGKTAQRAYEAASQKRFLAGRLDPKRLYVLLNGCAPPELRSARLRQLDNLLVIPPTGVEDRLPLAPAPPAAPFP